MAYRRSLSARVTLLTQRFHPSLSFVLHDDDGKCQPPVEDSSQPKINNFLQGQVQNRNINNATVGFGALFQDRGWLPFSLSSRTGSSFCSYSSNIGEGSDKIEYMSDVTEIFSDKSLELAATQAPVVNEVVIAAADSAYPVAALQYLIDGVHSFTGLNWWASIALTTVLIRGATLPFLINQLKATSKLNLMRPHLEQIKQQMQDMAMDPKAVAEGQKRMNNLFKEYGVTPFTPLKGLLIQGPIFMSFYFAISNMVEKVPSFKEGGAFWFTDLTTPDSLYIFPVLAALTFLITVECNMQEGLEGNPIAGTMKNFFRILAVLTIPFTSSFPKAMFCYWVTSNMFSLVYGLVLKRPQVKKLLGLPEIPMPSTTSVQQQQPAFPPFPWTKPSAEATQEKPSTVPLERSNISSDRKISSSSVISQRIRSLEKQIKAKKKNKKK